MKEIKTIEEAKELILAKAEEIKDSVDRTNFCKPDCRACLIAHAKGLIDEEYGIQNSLFELLDFGFTGKFIPETITDFALDELKC